MTNYRARRFKGQVVLVTGGTSGIGRATVLQAAAEGAAVVANFAHDEQTAAALVAQAKSANADILVRQADVTDRGAVEALVDYIAVRYGRLDVLINSHGVVRRGRLSEITSEMWDDVVDVNLKGVFLTCQAVAEVMRRQQGGSIVNISSMRGIEGSATSAHYAAAKAGVIALTKSLARELAPLIRVNSVAPGYVDTRIQAGLTRQQREVIVETTPLRRFGTPQDIAAAVLFLASEEAAFTTGQTLLVDGGRVM